MLHIEFRWSKPDESHSEKSKTETRKAAFCSSETPKSHGDDGPAAAGCPVSNPDNNCANGLLFKSIVHSNLLYRRLLPSFTKLCVVSVLFFSPIVMLTWLFLVQVDRGYRMPPPPGCPDPFYQIMMDCWKKDEMERPTFEYLRYRLEDYFVSSEGPYKQMD